MKGKHYSIALSIQLALKSNVDSLILLYNSIRLWHRLLSEAQSGTASRTQQLIEVWTP